MSCLVEKKLSDNEIVKIFECCYTDNPCEECPAYIDERCTDVGDGDIYRIPRLVADLINRLKEKNSNLTSDLTSLQKDLTSLQAENERLNNNISAMAITLRNSAKATRDEAYKEFADKVCDEITDAIISNGKVIKKRVEKHNVNRLEDNFCCMCTGRTSALVGIEYFIKNLLKELVGDNKCQE